MDGARRPGRVVAALVFLLTTLFLALCNIAGEPKATLYPYSSVSHGWPLTFVERRAEISADELPLPIWTIGKDVDNFAPASLVFNGFACLTLAAALAWAYRRWRRSRAHVWQFYVRDILAVVLVVGCVFAYARYCVERAARQAEVLDNWDDGESIVERALVGPDWLRHLVGYENPLTWFDPVVKAELGGIGGNADVTAWDVETMAQIETLEALDAGAGSSTTFFEDTIVLPAGMQEFRIAVSSEKGPHLLDGLANHPNLRRLILVGNVENNDLKSLLPQLTQLESLHLLETEITDDLLPTIAKLSKLRELRLGNRAGDSGSTSSIR